MKLYTTDVSPNCRRVEACLRHLGLYEETEVVHLNLAEGEHMSDAFRAINPNAKVPVVVIGNKTLWEAGPTMVWLADRAGAEDFCPSGRDGRFEVLRWMSWEAQHYNHAIGAVIWQSLVKKFFIGGEADEAVIAAELPNFHRFAAVLEQQLSGRDFVLGDTVTVADFAIGGPSSLVLHPASQIPLKDYPRIDAWYRRLEAVPAWAASAPKALKAAA